ncbi:stathmin domain-containing protein 1-like [Lytechinus variegatus]|uniref:stathmin domain-containing protein 1-like n=1 Tax=Lytechinus variegatus TaxID=7654 RepID=UPI001BB0E2A3|nr:stathmin domain-containing protein 1-like [Lytechinus variegatus]
MGCNSSKSTQVMELGPDGEVVSRKSSASSKRGRSAGKTVRDVNENANDVEVLNDKLGSTGSLGSQLDTKSQDRLVSSATSKISRRTMDSGLEADYGNVITEYSHPNMIDDRPETPDLFVTGMKCESRKSSGNTKARNAQTTEQILGELKSQGIISTSSTAPQIAPKKGGTSFDVMIAIDFDELKKPPPRLAKLKKKKKKSKKLTKEEVDAKLKAAEERREAKRSKLRAKLDTMKKEAEVHQNSEAQEEAQKKQVAEKVNESLDQAAKNREAKFKAMREKLEQKKRHAEKVRQAKLARMAEKEQNGDGEEAGQKNEEEVSAV